MLKLFKQDIVIQCIKSFDKSRKIPIKLFSNYVCNL